MEYLIGVILALAMAGLAGGLGFDRDRSFAPTVLIVVASYYVLFAILGGSTRALAIEIMAASGFVILGIVGFKMSPSLVAYAIIGHGVFDIVLHGFIDNPGLPSWWPGFCGAFDVVFGGWLAMRGRRAIK